MKPGIRGTVYTASRVVADPDRLFSPGSVAVAEGAVVAAGAPGDVARDLPGRFDRVDLPGLLLLPGLVNAHAHLQIPRMPVPGGGPWRSLAFEEWILRVIAWKRGVSPGECSGNVAAAAAESLSSGTTAVGEIAGPEIGAYSELPLRARIFAEGVGFLPEAADTVFASVESGLSRIAGLPSAAGGLVAPGISPHTLYTVGEPLLRRLAELARSRSVPAALHLAESAAEIEFLAAGTGEIADRLYPAVGRDVSFFRGIGMPIPEYLARAGMLREGTILVHAVHLSRREIDALREGGARFVLCPRSNAAHGNGSPDLTHFLDAGIPFGLGTDSLASVPSLSLWEEMRAAAGLYRGTLPVDALWRGLFRAATGNGARALRLPAGSLAPGSPADWIAVDDPGGPDGALFSRLGERTGAANVRLTMISGERKFERP